MQLDIVMLSPIQMHSLADAIYDSNGLISLDAVPGAAPLRSFDLSEASA